jgi:predicted AAA+ superfamily ATPase
MRPRCPHCIVQRAACSIVNRLARRGELHPGSELYDKAFENWVFHELTAFSNYRGCDSALSYWRLASGIEVDFVLGDMAVAIEAKSTVLVRLASSSPSSSIVFIVFYWKAE